MKKMFKFKCFSKAKNVKSPLKYDFNARYKASLNTEYKTGYFDDNKIVRKRNWFFKAKNAKSPIESDFDDRYKASFNTAYKTGYFDYKIAPKRNCIWRYFIPVR